MKRLSLIFIFISVIYLVNAQSWLSSLQLTSTSDLIEHASVIDDNGNVYIYGSFVGTIYLPGGSEITSYGGRDYFLIKFLADGSIDWIRNYGNPVDDFLYGGLDVDSDGNAYITGAFQGVMNYSATGTLTSSGTLDAFLIKILSNGNVDWAENIGQGFWVQYPTTLEMDTSGEILVAGAFRDSIVFNESLTLYSIPLKFDAFYAKFNSENGELIWAKQTKAFNGQQPYIWNIESMANGYYLSGTLIDTISFESDTITSNYVQNNAYIVRTDLSGNQIWNRKIEGNGLIYGYSLVSDDEGNAYISSYYEADTLHIEISEETFQEVVENKGSKDIYIIKYNISGEMDWYKSMGGKGNDRVFGIEFFDDKIWAAGYISDTVQWGGIELAPTATSGQDMFTGAFTKNGDPRDANIYHGEGLDESRAIFQNGDQLYTVMRSTSDNLVIGDRIYDSNAGKYYLVLGVIGCNPISIDNTIYTDVTGCFGDSTGAIQISASGGFGSPWQYSVDNGESYQESPYFPQLPVGDYQVLVIDKENCTEVGQLVALSQPDSLQIELISSADITVDADGSIVVGAQGGTSPYTYTLLPDNLLQGFGTFMFTRGDSGRYVVEVNDSRLCGPVSTDTIWIQDLSSVGINEVGGLMLRVFPNPATDVVTVEMPMEAAEVSMEVLSLTGQVVLSRQAYTTGGVLRETIDISELADGMYMLRLNGETLKSAFVVN